MRTTGGRAAPQKRLQIGGLTSEVAETASFRPLDVHPVETGGSRWDPQILAGSSSQISPPRVIAASTPGWARRSASSPANEDPDAVTMGLKAPGHAHESVGPLPPTQRLGKQRSEVPQISRHNRALLVEHRGEVDAVRPSAELRALANGDDIVTAAAELTSDLWRQMLVKQQLQPESASWAARQVVSSRSLNAWTRLVQASISSRLAP